MISTESTNIIHIRLDVWSPSGICEVAVQNSLTLVSALMRIFSFYSGAPFDFDTTKIIKVFIFTVSS